MRQELADALKGGNARRSLRRVSSTIADEIAALKQSAGPSEVETQGGGDELGPHQVGPGRSTLAPGRYS